MQTLHIRVALTKAFGAFEERQAMLKLHYRIETVFRRSKWRHGRVAHFRFERDECILVLCGRDLRLLHRISHVHSYKLSPHLSRQGVACLDSAVVTLEGTNESDAHFALLSELSTVS